LPPSSPERRLAAALVVAAALLAPAGAQPQSPRAAEIQARAQAVLGNPRFQRELPQHDESTESRPSSSRIEPNAPDVILPAIGAGAALARIVFLVLLVVAVVLLAVWLVGVIPWRRSAAPAGASREGAEPASAQEREQAFEDAAQLAAEGRYAEAIHALLLASIRTFAERSRTTIQPSRTSRELIRLLPLGAETRDAFTALVRDVEVSLFGGLPVSAEDYERSLSRFRLLTRRPA
jgi:Domain of unknown function (DUF4129)